MKTYVIIPASGTGKRMGSEVPKQFITVNGYPLLMHTIKNVFSFNNDFKIIVVLNKDHVLLWKDLCKLHSFGIPHEIVEGGKERFNSVKNALDKIPENTFVAIHDGVRPFVSRDTFLNTLNVAQEKGAAVPVMPLNDSIRKGNLDNSTPVNRHEYYLVQTPQCFISDGIKKAYQVDFDDKFTDDASVYENSGGKIYLTEGNRENIKITTPFDLKIAEVLISKT